MKHSNVYLQEMNTDTPYLTRNGWALYTGFSSGTPIMWEFKLNYWFFELWIYISFLSSHYFYLFIYFIYYTIHTICYKYL